MVFDMSRVNRVRHELHPELHAEVYTAIYSILPATFASIVVRSTPDITRWDAQRTNTSFRTALNSPQTIRHR